MCRVTTLILDFVCFWRTEVYRHGYAIINYGKTIGFRAFLTSPLVLNDPQTPLYGYFVYPTTEIQIRLK